MLFDEQVSSDHARKILKALNTLDDKSQGDRLVSKSKAINIEVNKKTSLEINNDGSQKSQRLIQMSEKQSKDAKFILKSHGYDPSEWELVSAKNSIWNSYNKQDGVIELYSSNITVKPVSEFVWDEDKARQVFEGLQTMESHYKPTILPQYNSNKNVLVIPIADFHYGMLADKYSTGNEYNLEIAEQNFYYTLSDILNRVKHKDLQKVLFILGNDFINFDNLNGTTTRGTPQDNSGLWFTVVERATQLIVRGIDMLYSELKIPIDIQYVPSNHDLHTMFGIIQTVQAHYRNDKNISIVDDSPMARKYYKIGTTLLALSHDVKIKDALKIVTTEAKDDWSHCDRIVCMLAHKHQAMVYDKQGYLEIMRLPTISGWSRWTNTMGYVQTEKKNKSFIINEKLGITDEINTIVP